MAKFSIRSHFDMADWAQMSQLFGATHAEDHVMRNRPLFDWFFLRNDDHRKANLVVAYEGDRLIGLLGYLPANFLWSGEVKSGAWMAHWAVLEEYRHGVGALLMRKITELYPIVAGHGANKMNQDIVTRMGFHFLEMIPKVAYVFKGEALASEFGWCKVSPTVASRDQIAPSAQFLTRENYRPDWDQYPSLRFSTLRDFDFLSARYLQYPFFSYLVFREGPAESPAVLICRLIDTDKGIRVARILEFFYPETSAGIESAQRLLGGCLGYFERNNCDYADYYCTSAAYISLMKDTGFFDDTPGALPSLLDPISLARKFQNFELKLSPELKARWPEALAEFFVSRADGDQDRPNKSFRAGKNESSIRR